MHTCIIQGRRDKSETRKKRLSSRDRAGEQASRLHLENRGFSSYSSGETDSANRGQPQRPGRREPGRVPGQQAGQETGHWGEGAAGRMPRIPPPPHAHTLAHAHAHALKHGHMQTLMYTLTQAHTHTHLLTLSRTLMHMLLHVHMHTCSHPCTRSHTRTPGA